MATLSETNSLPMKISPFLVNTIKMVDFPASYVSLQECSVEIFSEMVQIIFQSMGPVYGTPTCIIFSNQSNDIKVTLNGGLIRELPQNHLKIQV